MTSRTATLARLIASLCVVFCWHLPVMARGPVPAGNIPRLDTIKVAHPRALLLASQARSFIGGLPPANHFIVTSTADTPDPDTTDGIFSPPTLRAAIQNANQNDNYDLITFDLDAAVISLSSPLPSVGRPCMIDGSGTGATPITLDGGGTVSGQGLWLNANNCVVKDLIITNFNGNGLQLGSTVSHESMIAQGVISHGNNGAGINVNELKKSLIGGNWPGEGNVIYNNTGTGGKGISFTGAFPIRNDSNVIMGNWIGTSTGMDVAGNSREGIFLEAGRGNIFSNNIIVNNPNGAMEVGDEPTNFTSGNVIEHNLIGVGTDGQTLLNNGATTSYTLFFDYSQMDTISNNVIAGDGDEIINLNSNCANTVITGNLIGPSWDTTTTVYGAFENILIFGNGTEIRNNLIVWGSRGISIRAGGYDCVIQNNWCGGYRGFPGLLGNGVGVYIQGDNNLVGGADSSLANVLSNNTSGVFMRGTACSSNTIQNNIIGLTRAKDSAMGNVRGIGIQGASRNSILDNIIGGNTLSGGIDMYNQGVNVPSNNVIQRNFIGLSPVSATPFPNKEGIWMDSAHLNIIGGFAVLDGNIIQNNLEEGIWLNRANGNEICNNVISSNGLSGVTIAGGQSDKVRLNYIYDNGALGIDLEDDGVTANDGTGDPDVGPNTLLNFPIIDSIVENGSITAYGRCVGAADFTYILDFYTSVECDSTTFGEGEYWVDSLVVTADPSGVANFSLDVSGAFAAGRKWLTATATDMVDNTSEFCMCDTARVPPPPPDSSNVGIIKTVDLDTVNVGDTVTYTLQIYNLGPLTDPAVAVVDTIPAGMTYVDNTPSRGTWLFNSGVLTGGITNLPVVETVSVEVRVAAVSPGDVINYASAAGSITDGDLSNNRDSVTVTVEAIVSVGSEDGALPRVFALGDNYPNPFNPTTSLSYDLPEAAQVRIVIYNTLGQEVRTLVNASQPAGRYTVEWDGQDRRGNRVGSGVYLYRMDAGSFSQTRRMLLLK